MSKVALSRRTSRSNSRAHRKPFLILALLLGLCLAIGIFARWNNLRVVGRATVSSPPPQNNYAANNPTKEYVYAGGGLLATEEPVTLNHATYTSQSVRSRMTTGQVYYVSITLQNTGNNSWTPASNYKLRSRNQANWGTTSVALPTGTTVSHGSSYTFIFPVTAPTITAPGTFNFQWQMSQDGSGFFGETATAQVTVTTDYTESPFDFDGDGWVDIVVWRPSEGNWYIINSMTGANRIQMLGLPDDQIVPGDYDGDRRTDFAVWRKSNSSNPNDPNIGKWYIIYSNNNPNSIVSEFSDWGRASLGDIAVPADYDGDHKLDRAIFRPSEGNWYLIKSSTGAAVIQNWGGGADKPAPGDYDGDGKADITIFRPSEGNWYIRNSSNGTTSLQGWGAMGDLIVPADYDGDGKTDIAVWRPGEATWYIRNSSDGSTRNVGWGQSGDKLVPADYDGDGKTDVAVWRPSDSNWYIRKSSDNTTLLRNWGAPNDVPVPNIYIR